MNGSESYQFSLHEEPNLRSELEKLGSRFTPFKDAFWRAICDKHSITPYKTATLLIQGKHPDRMADFLKCKGFTLLHLNPHSKQPTSHSIFPRIGSDESGNGSYFGPVTFAGVLVTGESARELVRIGVQDSKLLSAYAIKDLAPKIKLLCPHSILVIAPTQYNEECEALQGFGTYYRILARGHAKVIEDILAKEPCHRATVDKFGREKFMKDALMERGRLIKLEQKTHGESDVAVAAASILARDRYKRELEALSTRYSIDLPAGVFNKAIEAGKEFVSRHGKDELRQVAKLHFRTTEDILNQGSL